MARKRKAADSFSSDRTVGQVAEDEYIVEKVVGKKYFHTDQGRILHYYIKWQGWGSIHNTWEPINNLTGCKDLVARFEKSSKVRRVRKGKPAFDENCSDSEYGSDEDEPEQDINDEIYEVKQDIKRFGISKYWPLDKVPIKMEGCFVLEKNLCYVIRVKTNPPAEKLVPSNTVIVQASSFRHRFPHIVIEFYEKNLSWTAPISEKDMREKTENVIKQYNENQVLIEIEKEEQENKENISVPEIMDVDDADEAQIFIRKDSDLFGLPESMESSSESEDENKLFTPLPRKLRAK